MPKYYYFILFISLFFPHLPSLPLQTTPFHMSMFGTTLEEVMEIQEEKFPGLDVPWVIVELCEAILHLRGPSTQGIFR